MLAAAGLVALAGCSGDDPDPGTTPATTPTLGTTTEQLIKLAGDLYAAGGMQFERVDAHEVLGSEDELTIVTAGVVDRLSKLTRVTTTRSGSSPEVVGEVLGDPALLGLRVESVIDNSGQIPTIYVQMSGTPAVSSWGVQWLQLDPPLRAGVVPELQVVDPLTQVSRVAAFAMLEPVSVDESTVTAEIEAQPSLAVQLLPSELALRLADARIGASDFLSVTKGSASVVDDELHVDVVLTDIVREAGELLGDPALVASTESADQVVRFVLSPSPGGETVDLVPENQVVTRRPVGSG